MYEVVLHFFLNQSAVINVCSMKAEDRRWEFRDDVRGPLCRLADAR